VFVRINLQTNMGLVPAPSKGFFTDTLVLWILSIVPELPKSPSFIMNKQMTKDQVRALKKGRLYFVRCFMWLEVKISLIEVMRCREELQNRGIIITKKQCPTQADILARWYNFLHKSDQPYQVTD
jgi:hypothetical protein